MPVVPLPENEDERLASLVSYDILDTLEEDEFDEITKLASQICETPVALITLIDQKRQWFKSAVGTDVRETPREYAFCSYTILEKDVLVVSNAREDARFANNPLVTGDPNVAFYAGAPIINEEGYPLGSICVIDTEAKELNSQQIAALKTLSNQVVAQLELRRKIKVLERSNATLLESNVFIQKFASMAAHDIKNPLSSILLSSQALQRRLQKDGDDKSLQLINMSINASKQLLHMVDEMLVYSKAPATLLADQQSVNLNELLTKIIRLIDVPESVKIQLPVVEHTINVSPVALEQIFLNLLTNAIRYNDKAEGRIRILVRNEENFYNFKVTDNGRGIQPQFLNRIFEEKFTLGYTDRFNKEGTGVGLHTVKALVEKLQGTIYAESIPGQETTFVFSIKK
ncbi:ATP-binding protein [Mucilaginibacter galii]|uniref:histidine kinase n=1 Tax=Mucilaginibacter galii TaxID=2005073 RepID=A0A917J765_9SPHI|nr:GAF domain-containing sensor histidine kinase [Mucilaginibacter galii]GGI49929.1 sensor histidine kinase [Mucilaginibacter galii]